MQGYYERDPRSERTRGQSAAEIARDARADKTPMPRRRKRMPLGEDRREVLRRMGLACPTCKRPL